MSGGGGVGPDRELFEPMTSASPRMPRLFVRAPSERPSTVSKEQPWYGKALVFRILKLPKKLQQVERLVREYSSIQTILQWDIYS